MKEDQKWLPWRRGKDSLGKILSLGKGEIFVVVGWDAEWGQAGVGRGDGVRVVAAAWLMAVENGVATGGGGGLVGLDTSKKSPMELINEVPPIKVEGQIVACEGTLKSLLQLQTECARNPALGHPVEFICLDLEAPAVCKYCGLRYVQDHGHHH